MKYSYSLSSDFFFYKQPIVYTGCTWPSLPLPIGTGTHGTGQGNADTLASAVSNKGLSSLAKESHIFLPELWNCGRLTY